MILFISFSFLLILLGLWHISKQAKNKALSGKVFLIVSFVGLFVLSGFRGLTVGTDTTMFVRCFNNVRGLSDINTYSNRFELGYRLFQCLIAQLRQDPHLLLIVSAFVTLALMYRMFYKLSDIPWYSVLVFMFLMFYYSSMNLLRQYIAIALTCTAFTFLVDKKRLRFLFFTILAGLFHTSAFIFIIILPISLIPLKSKNRYICVIISVITALFTERLIQFLIRLMPIYAGYLTSEDYYLQNKLGTFLNVAVFFIFFVVIDRIYSKFPSDDERTRLEYWAALVGFAITLASTQGWILSRMGTYFTVILCISLPNAISKIKVEKNKVILGSSILVGCFAYNMVIFVFRPYWTGVIPYYFWNQLPSYF